MIWYAPKYYATHQNMSLRSNVADWMRLLRKIPVWLCGMNFCISCTSSPCFASSLMQLWNDPKCTETLCNAPKHYATHQNMSLGSNGVDWCVHCKKSRRDFVPRTFALIALIHTVLHQVSCSSETISNAPKHYATHQNMRSGSGWLGAFIAKNPDVTSWHDLLH